MAQTTYQNVTISSSAIQCRRVNKQTRRSKVLHGPRNAHRGSKEDYEILPIGLRKSPTHPGISLVCSVSTKSGLGQRMDRCLPTPDSHLFPRHTKDSPQSTPLIGSESRSKRRPKALHSASNLPV